MHTSLAMESNSQEQYSSKSSSEQTDRSDSEQTDHVNYMISGGRFYECVFCKRGFATAQALGGHMNIHRKDRAKTKRSSVLTSSSSKPNEDYVKVRSYPSIPTNLQSQYYETAPDQVHTYYQDFFAPSTSFDFQRSSHPQYSHDPYVQNQRAFNLFGEDWRRNFGCIEDDKGKMEAGSEVNDLDLELRLGHYP